MADAVRAAGNARVEIVQIPNRTHMSILQQLERDGDPTSDRIIEFVRKTVAVK